MIEPDTVIFEDLNLECVIIFVVAILVPHIFRTFQYLVFIGEILRYYTVQHDYQIYAEFAPIQHDK